MQRTRTISRLWLSLLLILTAASVSVHAQIDLPGRIPGGISRKIDLASLMEGEPPISTSLEDAIYGDATQDAFNPEQFSPLLSLSRTPSGGFVLQPGFYEMHTQSYCLKAGTHGPGGGDGYLYAPPIGSAQEAVVAIVRNSVTHPEIEQRDVQVLLWAIIARAKFEDLASDLKLTASRLLDAKALASLNRSGLDLLPGPVLDRALAGAPPAVRTILAAEAQLRQMLTSTESSFDEIERVAVLAGVAPMGEGSREVPAGRWSLHPDGYYVRYLPKGYSHTLVQIRVPQGSSAVGKEYDPSLHIAVPGNTSRQRLIQSGRERI